MLGCDAVDDADAVPYQEVPTKYIVQYTVDVRFASKWNTPRRYFLYKQREEIAF